MVALIDGYDAALFDLDGVVYLGPDPVPGVPAALAQLGRLTRLMYVTNNAARPAATVVDQLRRLGIDAGLEQVLTSAQVASAALVDELPSGAKVLVCGSDSLAGLLSDAGFVIVTSADDQPAAVIQGYFPTLNWSLLEEAALAVQNGAAWYATNSDATRPTDRGLVPGAGAAIAVLSTVLQRQPTIFGKPYRPMMTEAIKRTQAEHPIFVGDRLDTDIEGAVNAGIDSLMVFSGAHGKKDLVAAGVQAQPSYIGADVNALLRPPRIAAVESDGARCGAHAATIDDGAIRLLTRPQGVEEQLDALWAITQLAWADPRLSVEDALAQLTLLD
ncbi:MAG: HAD-IIA family hydrolase [Propionicimonas sp.]